MSFNEEVSEIWDETYSLSARTISEDSLSGEDGSSTLAYELLSILTPGTLSILRRSFTRQPRDSRADRRVEQALQLAAAAEGVQFETRARDEAHDSLCITQEHFVAAIHDIFGHHKYTPHAQQLFQLLTPLGQRLGTWGELMSKLGRSGARRTRSRSEQWAALGPGVMLQMKHCKRECIVKLVQLVTAEWFCYACVTRGGRIGLYCARMQLLHQYQLWYHRTGVSRRVKNAWVTDMLFMSDVQCLVIAASDRSLTIYDASVLTHTPIFCITGMPHIPTCLAYAVSSPGHSQSELVIGDERGSVTVLTFLQPRVALLHKQHADKINTYFWMELSSPTHGLYCRWRRQHVHKRSVRRVSAMRVSCARGSPAVAVRVRGATHRILNVHRGVNCMQLVPSLRLLVTGSPDGAVRLWDVSQSSPYATLWSNGRAAVLDVAVVPNRQIVLAFSTSCTLDIWDLYEECMLQSIRLRFPFLGVLGRKAEFGSYCIHAGPPRRPVEDPSSSQEMLEENAAGSRRSSVYRGKDGGLKFIPELEIQEDEDIDVAEYNCQEVIISCCDYVCTIQLGPSPQGEGEAGEELEYLPPPGDTRRARRPSGWDISSDISVLGAIAADPSIRRTPTPTPRPSRRELQSSASKKSSHPQTTAARLTPNFTRIPAASPPDSLELDELLESAGLQGILEKDVTLMMPLKNDLNANIAELARNMDKIAAAVSAGAPYLALKLHEPVSLEPVDEMTARYRNILRLFPSSSSVGSTPRSRPHTSTPPRPAPSRRSASPPLLLSLREL